MYNYLFMFLASVHTPHWGLSKYILLHFPFFLFNSLKFDYQTAMPWLYHWVLLSWWRHWEAMWRKVTYLFSLSWGMGRWNALMLWEGVGAEWLLLPWWRIPRRDEENVHLWIVVWSCGKLFRFPEGWIGELCLFYGRGGCRVGITSLVTVPRSDVERVTYWIIIWGCSKVFSLSWEMGRWRLLVLWEGWVPTEYQCVGEEAEKWWEVSPTKYSSVFAAGEVGLCCKSIVWSWSVQDGI